MGKAAARGAYTATNMEKHSGVSMAHRRRAGLQWTRLVHALFALMLNRGDGREEE